MSVRWKASCPHEVALTGQVQTGVTLSMRRGVVDCATCELLTPRGMRTVAPGHPEYVEQFGGDTVTRDHAYHRGTVWPWPLGFYTGAALRAYGKPEGSRLRKLWEGSADELDTAGRGNVSRYSTATRRTGRAGRLRMLGAARSRCGVSRCWRSGGRTHMESPGLARAMQLV